MSGGPRVFKFGGTSVADASRIRQVADLVAEEAAPPVVVVSAAAGVTDALSSLGDLESSRRRIGFDGVAGEQLELLRALEADDGLEAEARSRIEAAARHVTGSPDPGTEGGDGLAALGEDLSALAVTAALRARGVEAEAVDARTVIRTDASFGFARPAEAAIRAQVEALVRPVLSRGRVPVIQGFVGATADGRTTTLGRGGSDLTATLLGAALEASEVQIWTDVDGILSGDPRLVEEPRVLEVVGFEEAVELAYFGARVIHASAAKQAVARGVPVRIRSTFRPAHPGTLILRDRWGGPGIAAVAFKPGVSLIQVRGRPSALPYGFLARVFEILARHHLPVDLVATSHTSTAFTVDDAEELQEVAAELEEVAEVEVRRGLATVTVVGNGLLREPGFDARVFGAVDLTPIHLVSQASDVSLSLVVDGAEAVGLVQRLHRELVERGRVAVPVTETGGAS